MSSQLYPRLLHLLLVCFSAFFLHSTLATETTTTPMNIVNITETTVVTAAITTRDVTTTAYVPIVAGEVIQEEIGEMEMKYFVIEIEDDVVDIYLFLDVISGDADVYVSRTNPFPTLDNGNDPFDPQDCVNQTACQWKGVLFGSDEIVISYADSRFEVGNFYVGVYGYVAGTFEMHYYLQINSKLCEEEDKIISTEDCIALRDLYTYCGGGKWNTNWLSPGTDPCKNGTAWEGVRCNSTMEGARVSEISLPGRNVICKINTVTSLSNLIALQKLDLSDNSISGSLPVSIWTMPKLENLTLQGNALSQQLPVLNLNGPDNFTHLDISRNSIYGYLTAEFVRTYPALVHFDISHNLLEGPISSYVANMVNLTHLDVSFNLFTSVPDLSSLRLLQTLVVRSNKLTGSLPLWTGAMPNLTHLDLGDNSFSGALTAETAPTDSIEIFSVQNNKLTGTIPPGLFEKHNLRVLKMGKNSLSGELSASISDLTRLETLWIDDNELSGSLPDSIGDLREMKDFNAGFNGFNGSLPDTLGQWTRMTNFTVRHNAFTGQLPDVIFTQWTQLQRINIRDNQFYGTIPSEFFAHSTLRTVIMDYNDLEGTLPNTLSPNMEIMYISYNRFDGEFPANIAASTGLKRFHFEDNALIGSIPEDIDLLTSLESFCAAFNRLSGNVPGTFGHLTSLASLDIQSNDFETLNDTQFFSRFPALILLNLQNNLIVGDLAQTTWATVGSDSDGFEFPQAPLGSLATFVITNNIIGGSLPTDFGDFLHNFVHIRMGSNRIQGTLPSSVSGNVVATTLDMRGNLLTGTISSGFLSAFITIEHVYFGLNGFTGAMAVEFSTLDMLQTLDLAHNKLSGVIPEDIYKLRYLETLDLSDNSFTDDLPLELRYMQGIRQILFSNNKFQGSLPTDLFDTIGLERFDLSNNPNVASDLPVVNIESVCNLRELRLDGATLYGTFPALLTDQYPSLQIISIDQTKQSSASSLVLLFSFPMLREISAKDNLFQGVWGLDDIDPFTSNFSSLERVDLSGNVFLGGSSFPERFSEMTALWWLNIQGCQFGGRMPSSFGYAENLYYLDASDNKGVGFSGMFQNNTRLMTLHGEGNVYSNGIVDAILPESMAVIENGAQVLEWIDLSAVESGDEVSHPWLPTEGMSKYPSLLTASVSHCPFDQIVPDVLRPHSLVVIDAVSAGLNGSVLLGGSHTLHLSASNNHFRSFSPYLGQYDPLDDYDTNGNGAWKNIQNVYLQSNSLEGEIPSSFFDLTELRALYLTNNAIEDNLHEGWLSLSKILRLDLSQNKFMGSINEYFGGFEYLLMLDLSDNNLDGFLPTYFENVTYDVDLSQNIFGCPLPTYESTKSAVCRCPDGYYALSMYEECIGCDPGTYSLSESSLDECNPCPLGTYQELPSQSFCHLCPAGQYADHEEQLHVLFAILECMPMNQELITAVYVQADTLHEYQEHFTASRVLQVHSYMRLARTNARSVHSEHIVKDGEMDAVLHVQRIRMR
eukprot:TRINITY_DN28433_c0_g2_i3.p1 TRINITY_DN28433_c0_g2~~TRINITY_DN28433_c0_g2_i3.p1  ORF type:complete len:1497 (-),score=267.72 TRINITY_DN28433_c0_g2_i3:686-5176(-)